MLYPLFPAKIVTFFHGFSRLIVPHAAGATGAASAPPAAMVLPPPWLTGQMEAPAGTKSMGSWTAKVRGEGRSKTPSSSFSLWPRLLKETLGQVCEKARVAQERARASARIQVIPQLLVLNEIKMQAI